MGCPKWFIEFTDMLGEVNYKLKKEMKLRCPWVVGFVLRMAFGSGVKQLPRALGPKKTKCPTFFGIRGASFGGMEWKQINSLRMQPVGELFTTVRSLCHSPEWCTQSLSPIIRMTNSPFDDLTPFTSPCFLDSSESRIVRHQSDVIALAWDGSARV